MKTEITDHILHSISSVYNASRNKQFDFSKITSELKFLSEKLGVSIEESFLFSIIFTQFIEDEQVDYSSIGKHLECNVIDVLVHSEKLKNLKELNLINEKRSRGRFQKMREEYVIPDVVQESILKNNFPIPNQRTTISSALEVLEKCFELSDQLEDEEISIHDCSGRIRSLLNDFSHFNLIKKIQDLKLARMERDIFLYVLWNTIIGTEVTGMSRVLKIFENISNFRIRKSQEIISGENFLISSQLLEIEKAHFFNNSGLKLGNKGLKLLEEEGIKIADLDKKNIIGHENIQSKVLFYNSKEKRNLNLLSEALKIKRFKEVQNMLDKKSLPLGFNCIFYGPPGTGKTEGVLQIAKLTARDVIKVEISETKSKWFGDSEKLIKKIFTNYEKVCRTSENVPILLFNEADAILSRRTEVSDSSIGQTINTIQNILLEELEKFEGIFIATTNLIDNLDKAFERRFLFKIQIDRPDIAARENIWKSKLDFLAPEQYLELARSFEFSGGEIENITRKIITHEIINAEKIDFEAILEFCHQEKFENNSDNKIEEKKTTILGFQNFKNEDPYLA